MADIKSLEFSTLKVPCELFSKRYRIGQKQIDKEIFQVKQSVIDIEKSIDQPNVHTKGVTRLLGNTLDKLALLKKKLEHVLGEETKAVVACKKRVDHLKEHDGTTSTGTKSEGAINMWKRTRLDRMLVDYFLYNGYFNTAVKLADTTEIKDLTNIDIFLSSKEVENSLKKHQTQKCLSWCNENKSKLRKLKSDLEFKLRMQEFIELVRKDEMMDAIKHSRNYFHAFEKDHLSSIQQVMALLAFPVNTDIECYKVLYDEKRWDSLVDQFRHECCRVYQLAEESVFTAALQAGLSALKTPQCYSVSQDSRNKNCPVCQVYFNTLAEDLPFAHCSQSRLYCRMDGALLNENNRPMMLPNGHIYGEEALKHMAQNNQGNIICPKTKEIFPYKKIEKVFVM